VPDDENQETVMTLVLRAGVALARVWGATTRSALIRRCDDRGDVPGWVLVTVMTAGLVAALWAVAGDMLTEAFSSAIQDTVGQP
jgi:hypothetical protein